MTAISKNCLAAIVFLLSFPVFGQEETKEFVNQTFRDTKVVNGHSVEMDAPGELKFVIGHRFGAVNRGWRDLYGLDQSDIRFGLSYGLTKNLTLGFGRSSFRKTYDGFIKYRLLHQTKGDGAFPLSIVYLGTSALNTTLQPYSPEIEDKFSYRMAYTHQLLIASKLSDRISIQVMPTLVHRNLVPNNDESNDVIAIGGAGRFQLSRTIGLSGEYYFVLPDQIGDNFYNPIAVGVDIETNGHVFQLHLTNSSGMIESFFVTQTSDDFLDGAIKPGFNISRIFVIRGRDRKRNRKSDSYK